MNVGKVKQNVYMTLEKEIANYAETNVYTENS
jgi:hypothetical protein